jgi:hypothetical protein
MNIQFDAIMFLALFTLGAGLVIGIISFTRAKQAQDHHDDAAVAQRQRHEDAEMPVEGTPGNIDPTVSDHSEDAPGSAPEHTDRSRNGVPVSPTDSGRSWSKERGRNPPTPMPPRN